MNAFKISDKYRLNSLSFLPGGHTVTVRYSGGKDLIYDKVKNPRAYIKKIREHDNELGWVCEILIDGDIAYSKK